jgi:hypothetical protein
MAKRNKQIISLAVCALALAAGLSVKPAMAYFTSYQTAGGVVEISITDPKADVSEEFSRWTKHITIKNIGDADCFIRVAAIAPDGYKLTMGSSDDWYEADGYYYYREKVAPDESTSVLDIEISGYKKLEDPDSNLPSEFNVIILQESTKVLYDKNNEPYADWSQAISTNLQGGE